MRSFLAIGVFALGCSGTPKNLDKGGSSPTPLTAKEILQRSTSAIVRIEIEGGSGTGFILDKSGLIATNLHVVAGSRKIQIKLHGGETYPVMEIAGVDPGRDLALLRIQPAKALPTLRLGDSDAMSAGDQVIAIGNPLNFDYSVTSGLVSQVRPECTAEMVALHVKHRARFEELITKVKLSDEEKVELIKLRCQQEITFFQISAPISQGSSGGPLFNQAGEVVGVTTAIVNDAQNINIAVPGNYLKPIVASPASISLDDFATKTGGDRGPAAPDDGLRVVREVPEHELTVLDGCNRDQIVDLVTRIWETIEVGAPVYNKASKAKTEGERDRYYEACFQIYEGTSNQLERGGPCKGVKKAFADGLARAKKIESYKLKAWAIRDTFDGLLMVAEKWAKANGISVKPSK